MPSLSTHYSLFVLENIYIKRQNLTFTKIRFWSTISVCLNRLYMCICAASNRLLRYVSTNIHSTYTIICLRRKVRIFCPSLNLIKFFRQLPRKTVKRQILSVCEMDNLYSNIEVKPAVNSYVVYSNTNCFWVHL